MSEETPEHEKTLDAARGAFGSAAFALKNAADGPGAKLPFRVRCSNAAAICKKIEAYQDSDELSFGWDAAKRQARSAKPLSTAAAAEDYTAAYSAASQALIYAWISGRKSYSAYEAYDAQKPDVSTAKTSPRSSKYQSQERRHALAKARLYDDAAKDLLFEAARIRSLASIFGGAPAGSGPGAAALFAKGIPVSSFRDPLLRGIAADTYSLWEIGLLCDNAFAASEGARLWVGSRGKSFAKASPKSVLDSFSDGYRDASILLSALGAPMAFYDLCRTSPFANSWSAIFSMRLCRRGLSKDPVGLLSKAMEGLGPLRFPFAEADLFRLARGAQNRLAWKALAKSIGPGSFLEEASDFTEACLGGFDPSSAPLSFERAAVWARAKEVDSLLSTLGSTADSFTHRQGMLLTALSEDDLPVAEALISLGCSLRDPAGPDGDSSDDDPAHPASESLRDRLLFSLSGPFPPAAMKIASRSGSPWDAIGALDALALAAISFRRNRKARPESFFPFANALASAEPVPGLTAIALRSLQSACPSATLQIVSDAFSLELSAGPAKSRSKPKAL